MGLVMVESKIKADSASAVQAASEKAVAALDAAQPEGIRYASRLLPDGETFVALLQVEDGAENPLPGLPEYQELLDCMEGSRAAPLNVRSLTLVGSHRLS